MWKLFATSRQESTWVTMCVMERGTKRCGVPHGEFWHGNSGKGGVNLLEVIKGEGSRGQCATLENHNNIHMLRELGYCRQCLD